MPSDDPWVRSYDLLADGPTPKWWVADPSMGARWHPTNTQNPRHSRAPYFTGPEAVQFVRRSISELLRYRRRHARGCPPGIEAREETWNRDPSRPVFVLVVSGRFGTPAVYVKWILPLPSTPGGPLIFISFHASTKTHERSH